MEVNANHRSSSSLLFILFFVFSSPLKEYLRNIYDLFPFYNLPTKQATNQTAVGYPLLSYTPPGMIL